jgi:hypothetical protein
MPGDSTKVELVKATRAVYPLEAQNQGIQGQVMVKILISEKGDVKSAEVLSGDPLLSKSPSTRQRNGNLSHSSRTENPPK